MIIKAKSEKIKLVKHIDHLLGVEVECQSMYSSICIVRPEIIYKLIEDNPDILGTITYICLLNDELLVFPKPLEDTKLRIIGSVLIEQ